jgi:DNA-binding transcriptional MerR regulator
MTSKYSIKDLEHLSGIKAHTLRMWEQRYDFIIPKRTSTNIRFYEDEDLKLLLNTAVLIKSGLRISKVSKMTPDEIRSKVLEEAHYRGDLESQVSSLKIAMLDYNEELLEKVLSTSLLKIGTEETFAKLVSAFICEIGVLWQTNAISIAHEHFVTNLLKQKLFSAIDQLNFSKKEGAKTFILYLPENELHELGLLYAHYKLKKAGHRSIFLGQALPVEYLKDFSEKIKVDHLVSIFTINPPAESIDTYFQNLFNNIIGANIMFHVTGYQTSNWQIPSNLEDRVKRYSNLEHLLSEIGKF